MANIDQLREVLAVYSTTDATGGRAFRLNSADGARLAQIKSFDDVVISMTYFNQGTADERFNTVTYSSVKSNLANVVLTFAYVGSSGSYSVSSVTYS